MRVENQTKTWVWEDSSLCPETSTKNAVQEFLHGSSSNIFHVGVTLEITCDHQEEPVLGVFKGRGSAHHTQQTQYLHIFYIFIYIFYNYFFTSERKSQMKVRRESNINVWFLFMYSHKWKCAASLFPKHNYIVLFYFHIHVFVSDIPRIRLPIFLQPNRQIDPGNI